MTLFRYYFRHINIYANKVNNALPVGIDKIMLIFKNENRKCWIFMNIILINFKKI